MFSTLRKIADDNDEDWDEYTDGALFAINTNRSKTTKFSSFYLMYGRHPRLPLELQKYVEHVEHDPGGIEKLARELTSEDVLQEHVQNMTATRDALFPKVQGNIEAAQEKQKKEFLKRKGGFQCTFQNGDAVLRCNMLQKTKKGHKMEDQWTGPYTIEEVDLQKGTCRLRGKSGEKLRRIVNMKDLKAYRVQCTAQQTTQPPLQHPHSSSQHSATTPQHQQWVHSQQPVTSQQPAIPLQQPTQSQQLPPTKSATVQQSMSSQQAPSKQPTPHQPAAPPHRPTPMPRSKVSQQKVPSNQQAPSSPPTPPNQQAPSKQQTSPNQQAPSRQPKPTNQPGAQQPAKDQPFEPNKKMQDISKKEITSCFDNVINDHLSEVLSVTKESWRHEIFHGRIVSDRDKEMMGREDLRFNVPFGDFEENQTYHMVNLIAKNFPKVSEKYLMKVLLPEALTTLCCQELQITYNQGEDLLEKGGKREADAFMQKIQLQRRKGKFLKKKEAQKRKMQAAEEAEDEVKFLKQARMDQTSIAKMQRPTFKLHQEDADIIQKNAMLTDHQIQMAQELLHHQFPYIEGLLSPTIGKAKQFPVMRNNFIQVLHTGGMHWVCVSNIGCRHNNQVKLYDSLYSGIAPFTREQIGALLFNQDSDVIEICVPPVDQQTNGKDCGVFAIEFATALCYNMDPTSLKFNRQAIRAHLFDSLKNGYIGIFPFEEKSSAGYEETVAMPVYCDCRLPYNPTKDQMAECTNCKKWFHQACQKIPDKVFKYKRFQWKCNNCQIA